MKKSDSIREVRSLGAKRESDRGEVRFWFKKERSEIERVGREKNKEGEGIRERRKLKGERIRESEGEEEKQRAKASIDR